MDILFYNYYKNKETFEESTTINYMLIIFEVLGMLIGLCMLLQCKYNIIYNLIIYIFCPWLFIILHCYSNTCNLTKCKNLI